MPTVHREGPFRFVIWLNDHRPPHVHCFTADEETVLVIESGEVREAGMQPRHVDRAVAIVAAHREMFMAKWREIHGV